MKVLSGLGVVTLLPTFLEGLIKFIYYFLDYPNGGDDLIWWLYFPAFVYILRFLVLCYMPVRLGALRDAYAVLGSPVLPALMAILGLYRLICFIYKIAGTGMLTLLDSFPWTRNVYCIDIDTGDPWYMMLWFLVIIIGDFMMVAVGACWINLLNSADAKTAATAEQPEDEEEALVDEDVYEVYDEEAGSD